MRYTHTKNSINTFKKKITGKHCAVSLVNEVAVITHVLAHPKSNLMRGFFTFFFIIHVQQLHFRLYIIGMYCVWPREHSKPTNSRGKEDDKRDLTRIKLEIPMKYASAFAMSPPK